MKISGNMRTKHAAQEGTTIFQTAQAQPGG
jgi:hypothetical protein